MSTIVVHNLEHSRSFRVLWLLDELALNYQVKQYSRNPQADNGPASLKKLHPLGKSPLITVGDNVVAETGAIFDYVLGEFDKSNQLSFPQGSPEQYKLNYWLHFSEGSLMSFALVAYYLRAKGADNSDLLQQLDSNLSFLESELSQHSWFVGEKFSAADINLEFPIAFLAVFPGIDFAKYPKVAAWLERIKQRPAYQKALKSNGHYDLKALFP